MFSIGSPKFPMCSPTLSPYHLIFIPYASATVVLLSPIQVGKRGGILYFKKGPSILRSQ